MKYTTQFVIHRVGGLKWQICDNCWICGSSSIRAAYVPQYTLHTEYMCVTHIFYFFHIASEAAHHGPHKKNHIRTGAAGPLFPRGPLTHIWVRVTTHTHKLHWDPITFLFNYRMRICKMLVWICVTLNNKFLISNTDVLKRRNMNSRVWCVLVSLPDVRFPIPNESFSMKMSPRRKLRR